MRFRASCVVLAGIVGCGNDGSGDDGSVPLPDRDLDAASDGASDAMDGGTSPPPPADSGAKDTGSDARVFTGCNGAVDCERVVFVTTKEYAGGFGGIAEADQRCQTAADMGQSPLVKNKKFVAWISTTNNAVAARLVHGTKQYRRTDGATVASSWNDLTDGSLDNGIGKTEDGADPGGGGKAWTGTKLDGSSAGNNCNNWKDTVGVDGRRGNVGGNGNGWSDSSNDACSNLGHLYCFEY